jgi:hypothetical protein
MSSENIDVSSSEEKLPYDKVIYNVIFSWPTFVRNQKHTLVNF